MTNEDGSAFRLVGDIVTADCQLNPEDQLAIAIAEDTELGSLFGVYVEAVQIVDMVGETGVQLILAPKDARRIAAAILNAADAVDGTVPLCFYERPAGDE